MAVSKNQSNKSPGTSTEFTNSCVRSAVFGKDPFSHKLWCYEDKLIWLLALSTKMSQLGHYETIHTLGMCIGNVVHEQNPVKMTSLIRFRMLELYFKNP